MKFVCVACLLLMLFAVGCGGSPRTVQPITDPGPLAVEEWKEMPEEIKYDDGTFQRLRSSDPKLKSDRAWDKFFRQVIIPERKEDIPGIPGG